MEIETRLKVTAELCCDFLRNAAYYKSGWATSTELKKKDSDFWINLNGNFLDIAVLSWCFLFADSKAEFRWQKLIDDQTVFSNELFSQLSCTNQDFDDYISYMRIYRDKRVAHRDRYLLGDPEIHFPDLNIAITSTIFLYSKLFDIYPGLQEICPYRELESFFKKRVKLGAKEHSAALGKVS